MERDRIEAECQLLRNQVAKHNDDLRAKEKECQNLLESRNEEISLLHKKISELVDTIEVYNCEKKAFQDREIVWGKEEKDMKERLKQKDLLIIELKEKRDTLEKQVEDGQEVVNQMSQNLMIKGQELGEMA